MDMRASLNAAVTLGKKYAATAGWGPIWGWGGPPVMRQSTTLGYPLNMSAFLHLQGNGLEHQFHSL